MQDYFRLDFHNTKKAGGVFNIYSGERNAHQLDRSEIDGDWKVFWKAHLFLE